MGFLDRFRKKQEEPVAEKPSSDVKLQELSAWLSEELSNESESARKKSRELQDRIAQVFSKLRDSAKRLGKAEFEKQDKTYAAVNSTKDSFSRKAVGLADKKPPAGESYSSLVHFQKKLKEILRELTNISPRQGMILSSYFKKEGASVIANIKDLTKLSEDFQKFLDWEGKSLFVLEENKRLSKALQERLEDLKGLEAESRSLSGEIKSTKASISEKEKALQELSRDARWTELEKARKGSEAREAEAQDMKFQIGEELSYAKRPLKKFLHLRADQLSREERLFLERFVKSPLKTVMGGSKLQELSGSLSSLRDMVSEINLKEKEVQKLNDLISKMDSGELAGLMDRYRKLLEEISRKASETEERFSGLSEEKLGKEKALEESKNRLNSLQKELESKRQNAKSMKEDIQKDIESLERLIEENINRKVNIILNNGAIG